MGVAAGELGIHPADVAPIEGNLDAGGTLPRRPQPMAPVGYRRGRAYRRTRRTVKVRAVDRRRTGRYVDRIVEGDAAAEAGLEAAGLVGGGAQTQVVTPLVIDPAIA